MLPEHIHLEIVSPERLLFSGKVDAVTVPGQGGYLGILPGHAPLLSQLQVGEISFHQGDMTQSLFCDWGFVEVLPQTVSVLAHIAEKPADIDMERARKAKERAERRIRSHDPATDFNRAQLSLQRAVIRLQVGTRK